MFTIVYHRLLSPLRGAGSYVKTLNTIKQECIDSAAKADYLVQLKKLKDEENRIEIRVSNLEELAEKSK